MWNKHTRTNKLSYASKYTEALKKTALAVRKQNKTNFTNTQLQQSKYIWIDITKKKLAMK